jgi:hypothetical protein
MKRRRRLSEKTGEIEEMASEERNSEGDKKVERIAVENICIFIAANKMFKQWTAHK